MPGRWKIEAGGAMRRESMSGESAASGGKARPLAAAWRVYAAGVVVPAAADRRANDGHRVYALDDAFIRMAVARDLATHGTFAVTSYEFSASSSRLPATAVFREFPRRDPEAPR